MKRIVPFARFSITGLLISFIITSTLIGITIYRGSFNFGIDFRSGQNIEIEITDAKDSAEITKVLEPTYPKILVSEVGNASQNTYNIKIPSDTENQEKNLQKVLELLKSKYSNVNLLSSSFIGSSVSQNLLQEVTLLGFGALFLILLYVWLRFRFQFAISAILALMHDALFIVGFIGAFQIEFTTSTIAAILTIIGYSLNDTIVIFDRIRENIVLVRDKEFKQITDISITKTLSRTLITSLTTLLAVLALMTFSIGDVYNFALSLTVGIIEGTWSSIFIATPFLHMFSSKKILEIYRSKQGSGVQYTTSSSGSVPVAANIHATKNQAPTISKEEVEKIREEVLAKQQLKKKK